jgi:hypothetical protein
MILLSHSLVYARRNLSQNITEILQIHVYSNTIHNSQIMTLAYQQWMDKENLVYKHNGILFTHKEEKKSCHL